MKIQIIIISLFITLLTFPYLYIKIKHKYWSNQPVSHYHSLLFLNQGIISNDLIPTIIISDYRISTFATSQNDILDRWVKLLRSNYIPILSESLTYQISQNYLRWTVTTNYNPLNYDYGLKELVGTITSKEINIQLGDTPLNIRYVDYLCIDTKHRSKNLASMLISHMAHEYPGKCFIFKKEIYPLPYLYLVKFDTFMLSLDSIKLEQLLSTSIYKLSRKSTNKEILECFSYYQKNSVHFQLYQKYTLKEFIYYFVYSDYVYTYYILDNNKNINSIIVLFDSQFTYQNQKVLELFLYLKDTDNNLSSYLKHTLAELKNNNNFQYIYVSDIGNNKEILDSFENNK